MSEELLQLISQSLNPETATEATVALTEVLNSPEIFEQLFAIITTDSIDLTLRKSAAVYLGRAFSLQKDTIDESFIQTLKERVQQLIFDQLPQQVCEQVIGLSLNIYEKIKFEGWPELLMLSLINCNQPETFNNSLYLLSSLVDSIPKNILLENIEQILQIANAATHNENDSWEQRQNGFRILKTVIGRINNPEILGDIQEYLHPILEYPHDPDLFNKPPTNKQVEDVWNSLDEIILSGLLPQSFYESLLPLIMEISTNTQINSDDRGKVLHTISGIITELNQDQLNNLFDVIFDIGKNSLEDNSVSSIIDVCFEQLDNEVVYSLIKERIEGSLSSQNIDLIAFGNKVLSLVVSYSPDIAIQDISFINDTIKTCLEAENDTLSESVCVFLDSIDADVFSTCTVICSNMLVSILPFLISENESLRSNAYSAVHNLCEMIDCDIEGFFPTTWELREHIFPDDLESYTSILGCSISYADIGDDELDALLEYISSLFSDDGGVDVSVSALNLVSAILKNDDSQSEDLLIPSFDLCMQAFMSTNIQTQTTAIDFIGEVYPFFHEQFVDEFTKILRIIQHIALSILTNEQKAEMIQEIHSDEPNFEEEDLPQIPNIDIISDTAVTEDSDGSTKDSLQIPAISTLSVVCKSTNNSKLASLVAQCLIASLEIPDSTGQTQMTSYEDANKIIKLLNPMYSLHLFQILHKTITTNDNPSLVSQALKPYMKLIHRADPTNEEEFHQQGMEVLSSFFNGQLPCMNEIPPLEGKTDHNLIVQIAFLITEILRFSNPEETEIIISQMLQILQIPSHLAAFAYIGAFSDAIKFGKLSSEHLQQLFEILPQLVEVADTDPDLQHNIAFLLNVIIQSNPSLINDVSALIETIWGWFSSELQQGSGWQLFLSNAASLFLTIAVNNPSFSEEYLISAFSQFPPYDYKETSSMCQTIIRFFSVRKEFSNELIGAASISIANLLLMQEADLTKRKITPELYGQMKNLLKTIVSQHEVATQFLHAQFQKSRAKMSKLSSILE